MSMIPQISLQNVQKGYADLVKRATKRSLLLSLPSCCDPAEKATVIGRQIGYSEDQLRAVPQNSNLGIGCGNPTALASIRSGETVLDLGSGAGFDCFLAANATGPSGKVIGVDITPEMVEQAQKNAKKGGFNNVEFLTGNIESLSLESNSIDVIISNCVINLSDQKDLVFRESFRVLKPKGRMMISDIILLEELPNYIKKSVDGHIACLSGAVTKERYLDAIKQAGFEDIQIDKQTSFPIELMLHDPIALRLIQENQVSEPEIESIGRSIASVTLRAYKR